jgi:hypothetical protein
VSVAEEVERIVASIHPLLVGQAPQVQGAALADLLATWVAGHIILGDAPETDALRRRLVEMHIEMVRKLVTLNAARLWAESGNA